MQLLKQAIKDVVCAVKIKCNLVLSRKGDRHGRIIILMYHRVNLEQDILGLTLSPSFFDQQMTFLSSRFKVISLPEAITMLSSGMLSGEFAVITFDDGYRDNYDYAFPILKKHHVPATIFVTVESLNTGYFGWRTFDQAILNYNDETIDLTKFSLGIIDVRTKAKKELAIYHLHQELKQCANDKCAEVVNHIARDLSGIEYLERIMLTWDEAKEMQESGLINIASHTMTHPILTRISHEKTSEELVQSKAIIENKLGTVVDLFAYPNGTEEDFDDDIVKILVNAGYRAACTTIPGSIRNSADLFRLPRVDVTFGMCQGIGGRFSPEMFEVALSR